MPLYEYTCQSCGQTFEKLVRSAAQADQTPCTHCNSPQTTRALSLFAAVSSDSKPTGAPTPMCGRCGGPGPCAMG